MLVHRRTFVATGSQSSSLQGYASPEPLSVGNVDRTSSSAKGERYLR